MTIQEDIKAIKDRNSVELDCRYTEGVNGVYLMRLFVPYELRGNVIGNNVMSELITVLDNHKYYCTLNISTTIVKDVEIFANFFKKYGFEVLPNGNSKTVYMKRNINH